jgi:hypothetical protein
MTPRQSPSSSIRASMRRDGEPPSSFDPLLVFGMVVALVPRAHIFSPGNALACFTQATNCDRRIAVALRDLRIADVERRIPVDRDRAKQGMKRILITGMSGTGKSSAIQELAARGYQAHDLDTPEWSEWVDADPADTLPPKERTGSGAGIASVRFCPGREKEHYSSPAAPRTWRASSH